MHTWSTEEGRPFHNKCSNIIERHTVNDRGFKIEQCNSEQLRNPFFVKTVIEWNHLEESVVHTETVEGFKAHLQCD